MCALDMANGAIDKQYDFFKEQLPELLKKGLEGKYALIHDSKFIGSFDTEQAAYEEGVKSFGTEIFIVQKIAAEPTVETIQFFRHVHLQ
jgi:hypothetical protein